MEKFFQYQNKSVRTAEINGVIWFVATDVCAVLEISNPSEAIKLLDTDDYALISTEGIAKSQPINMVNESGLYSLILGSRKPEARAFKKWVTQEVLPQIRQIGQYIPSRTGVLPLQEHTRREVQIQMSKNVSGRQYRRGGKLACQIYHTKNCLTHTGKTPTAIREEGKKLSLPSKITKSAREVARRLYPAKACSMSFADNLVEQGHNEERVFPITKKAEPVFKDLLKLGVMPAELKA